MEIMVVHLGDLVVDNLISSRSSQDELVKLSIREAEVIFV